MTCESCTMDHRCKQGRCEWHRRPDFNAGPGFAFVDTKALGGPKYRGPERRIPLDSPLLRRVVLVLLGFWAAVALLAPLAMNLWARWAS